MSYEYRVAWRRERSGRRTRIYQTEAGARDFARFLELSDNTEIDDEGILYDNLIRLGDITEVQLERRTVSEWEPVE